MLFRSEKAVEVKYALERNLNMLGTIATISPLLGLLGTVVGMIAAFTGLTESSGANPDLLAAGITVFAVSWRNPTPSDREWNLETYAESVIQAIEVMKEISGQPTVNVMGLCAGGITTAAAIGLLNAKGDESVHSHSLFVNILDNRPEDSDFGLFVSERSIDAKKSGSSRGYIR